MSGRLSGKVAIVTGSASGFGRATAVRFAKEGAKVVVADLNEAAGKATVEEIRTGGGESELHVGDVSDYQVSKELVNLAETRFGGLDVLVNNAGISHHKADDTWNMNEEDWDRMIQTNLRSVYACSRAAIPTLIERGGGSIVSVASIAVAFNVGGSAYGAAKGGLLSYSRHIAVELATRKVRANCVSPGVMRSPMTTGEREGLTPEQQEARLISFGARMPMAHVGSMDDIANAILFLASDEAAYITGQEIIVDGGYSVRGG